MADEIDKELSKKVLGQIFPKPSGRRAPGSPMRGEERRTAESRRTGPGRREGGRRLADDIADIDRRRTPRIESVERRTTERRTPDKFSDRRSGYAGRRVSDRQPHVKSFERAERTHPGSATGAGARAEAKIFTAPVVRRAAGAAPKIARAQGILSKAGRWGRLGAIALGGGYAAYRALKD